MKPDILERVQERYVLLDRLSDELQPHRRAEADILLDVTVEITRLRSQLAAAEERVKGLEAELSLLREAIYPGLPQFQSTPEKPKEDFYILFAYALNNPGEPSNGEGQSSDGQSTAQEAGKAD